MDPREMPLYTFPEASKATDIPVSTLRAWFIGTTYTRTTDIGHFEPVVKRPNPHDTRLSFTNLIEAHILRALRQVHEVKMSSIRDAMDIAEKALGIDRLLINSQLKTSARKLFLDQYTKLLELNQSQQYAMRVVLNQFLQRIEYDATMLPSIFYPLRKNMHSRKKIIVLSPFISFGQAIVHRRGISTSIIAQRYGVGESKNTIITDYGITEAEFGEAVLYEETAA